jgi:hypothetical protein
MIKLTHILETKDPPGPLTEAPSVISMKESEKVWDALVKKFSDNKNDSIEYLNKDRTYRNMAIKAIFTATKF